MENPASIEFVDIKRAMDKNTFGQPFEIICGHVKVKKKSGEAGGERPFLYLVKEDEAFIVGANPEFNGGDRVSRPLHQREFALTESLDKRVVLMSCRCPLSANSGHEYVSNLHRRTWSQQLSDGQSSGSTLMMEAP